MHKNIHTSCEHIPTGAIFYCVQAMFLFVGTSIRRNLIKTSKYLGGNQVMHLLHAACWMISMKVQEIYVGASQSKVMPHSCRLVE